MVKTLLDENQIEQVFINLLLNAIHAVEENGRVTIQTAVDSENNKVQVEITDNGCGIAADDIKKIFEPFYSTKAKGTGLGLAVSYGIVKNHQGDIRVYSVPGKITRFTIELPIQDENSSEKGNP
jgi:signal transduction histidine kinase